MFRVEAVQAWLLSGETKQVRAGRSKRKAAYMGIRKKKAPGSAETETEGQRSLRFTASLLICKELTARRMGRTHLRCLAKTIAAVIETGNLINEAKRAIARRGQFLHMVKTKLPFGREQAWRLMQVAANPMVGQCCSCATFASERVHAFFVE